jgi:cholesterol oxidase
VSDGYDADVVVIGSGFGGAVAALRFAEAGHRVIVLERGGWVTREGFEADLDWFWNPERGRFGPNDIRRRGDTIAPWVGAAVGGGSHVYAGTLLRRDDFDDFPAPIRETDMSPYYDRAESMLCPQRYPDWPPYDRARATQLLLDAGETLAATSDDVEDHGRVPLGISFAPADGTPGETFVNPHGSEQRYFDPAEQSLLGGDIGAKNTLDHNYLFLAQKAGAEIRDSIEVDHIEPLDAGGYRVSGAVLRSPDADTVQLTARRVVVAAGSLGSTQLMLRNRDVHGTLANLSDAVGSRYSTNGDFVSGLMPHKWIVLSWLGFVAGIIGLALGNEIVALCGVVGYGLGMLLSGRAYDPDIGATNSDFIRFRGLRGQGQGAYIEGGRYPTPGRLSVAVVMSLLGAYRPHRYRWILVATNWLRRWVPPFALFARTWPIPLLKMGRDEALGTIALDESGRAVIRFDQEANREYYAYLDALGRRVAQASGSWWLPNVVYRAFRIMEIPHNQGGLPMGTSPADGVVDDAGRVYGHDDLMVLDGSIVPVAIGPNPALTITAVCERAMEEILAQIERDDRVSTD